MTSRVPTLDEATEATIPSFLHRRVSTRGERHLHYVESQLERLRTFSNEAFDERDLVSVVLNIGASVEQYLLLIVPNPGRKYKNYFHSACSEVGRQGYTEEANAFNDLKNIYNDTKHTEHYLPSLQKTRTCVGKVATAISRFNSEGLGSTALVVFENSSVFWVAATDHYTSGETEISITLPSDLERLAPLPIDRLIIHSEKWDAYKAELMTWGKIVPSKEAIPEWAITALTSDDDSLTPFAYVGDYSGLLKTGAKYEYRAPGLIPSLSREASFAAMNLAFVLACIDVARRSPVISGSEIAQHAIELATTSYGFSNALFLKAWNMVSASNTPEDKEKLKMLQKLKKARTDVAKIFASLPFGVRQQLAGPTWVDAGQFERLKKAREKYSELLGVAIGPDFRIILRAGF